MNPIRLGVLTLLKSAITGDMLPLPEGFDMEQALPVLHHHGIQTMGYLGAVNCGILKSDAVMQELFRCYCSSAVISQRQLDKIDQVFSSFDANGIDYMPLKGAVLKHLYPSHELRPMGDADILIRVEQYNRIRPIMERLGFSYDKESEHELHWRCPELHVELHKSLMPSTNHDLYDYYQDGWQLAKPESGHRYQMSLEDQFVFLFTHFAKHFRGGGIGCRHVVDIWVFLSKHSNLNKSYICQELDKLHLLEFYGNLRNLINAWFFGASWDDKSELISDFIFSSGVWGDLGARYLASNARYVQKTGRVGRAKWRELLGRVFPSFEYTSFRYPVLKKTPVLFPLIWIVRWLDILLSRPDLVKRRFRILISDNNEDIIVWKQNMDNIGLKYRHNS